MANDSYKTLRVSVRPARVACLIDSTKADWQERVLIALEAFSRTWGGAGFIIVPTDGKIISKPFWQILLAYDPDYFWIARITDDYRQKLILSDELVGELKLRLAPFHHDDSQLNQRDRQSGLLQNLITENGAYPDFEASYPFTDVTTILPNCAHSTQLAEVSDLQGIMRVWASASTGRVSANYKEQLAAAGVRSVALDYSNNLITLFKLVVNGVQGNLTEDEAAFPFSFSLSELSFYRSLEFHDWAEATLVIVGDTVQDFCLYFCLSRMRKKVAWLLPAWLPEELTTDDVMTWYNDTPLASFARALRDLAQRGQQRSVIHFFSASLETDKLESVRELFKRSSVRLEVGEGLPTKDDEPISAFDDELSKSLGFLLQHPTRVFEYGNVDKIVSKHFIGSQMAGFFETPKPKNFSLINRHHHWITDFSIVGQQFPRHPLLGTKIVRDPVISHRHARTGRDGVAFADPRTGYINDDIDTWLRKPEIDFYSALGIFELLLNKNGYRAEISDKGRFALSTISKFGGIASLAYFVLNQKKRAVFEKYTAQKPAAVVEKDAKPTGDGLFLKSDNRRYLNFAAFKQIFGDDFNASSVIYDLLAKAILYRGLILKCYVCRSTDWFNIAELSHEFRCKRCGLTQVYQRFHALDKLEPTWFYKLDEIVYKAMTQNFTAPLLATYRLQRTAKSFDYSPELELLNPQTNAQLMELDICCIPDGQLTIGEAKISNRLGKSAKEEREAITKYYELAEKLGASQVVFATASEEWRAETARMIVERFSDSITKVVLWSKKELYDLS